MDGRLLIYSKSGSVIASVEKWEFTDTYMGEQNITFDIKSPKQIPWTVGCFCHYRGETYTLNYIPTTTQTSRRGESGEAFKYDDVKFESAREELTRIIMLDVTATTGDYVSSLGTNYTGSSQFSLYCGETTIDGTTRTAVCTLCGKIFANLIRLGTDWHIAVDLTSTHKVNGVDILNTHTDDKVLTFDNTTVQAALEMIHTEFDLDYCVKGRMIYVGYSLDRLTDDGTENHDFFYFGYGRGMASKDEQGKSLYEIKKSSDSSQKIITRLRALGSTRNIPYRYYNKKFDLPQSLFPQNLQLPGTFLVQGEETDEPGTRTKWGKNNGRKDASGYSYCNAVLGDTNDAYIDKNNDAVSSDEGIREDSARWDGSNSELEEIYPTIKEMTYGELRKAGVHDILDIVPLGESDMNAYKNYENSERVDEVLSFDSRTNYGDGLLAENQGDNQTQTALVLNESQQKNRVNGFSDWNQGAKELYTKVTLFTLDDIAAGNYLLSPITGNVAFEAIYSAGIQSGSEVLTMIAGLRFYITDGNGKSLLVDKDGNSVSYYDSKTIALKSNKSDFSTVTIEPIPDAKEGDKAQVDHIKVTTRGKVVISVTPYYTAVSDIPSYATFTWRIGLTAEQRASGNDKLVSQFWWGLEDSATTYMNTPFVLYIKDFGVQSMLACFNTSDDPVIAMTTGRCTGREFKIVSENPEKVVINGKNCWKVECSRAEDSSLKTYYPSEVDPIEIGDNYVLLNVAMPDSYVEAAEERLLVAATQYLKDNCDTKFTYEPSLDDIYLQREYDKWEALGEPEKSIYWKLYAGLKFPFYGIPEEGQEASDVLASITIQKVTIKEGEGSTPKVELTLNDDVQQSTIQKLTTAVDRIYNGSLFGTSGGTGSLDVAGVRNQIRTYGADLFLSKQSDDTAKGKITFQKGARFGSFETGMSGADINEEGNAEFGAVNIRESLTVPKLVYNRTEVVGGNTWRCAGGGEIDIVEPLTPTTGVASLKLEDGEIGMIAVGDICMGIFHLTDGVNESDNQDSKNGDFKFAGFKTIYFRITSVSEDNTSFEYELREGYTTHPQPHMNFAAYGNTSDTSRQTSELQTREYTLLLQNVSSWNYGSDNIVLIIGKLDGFTIKVDNGKEVVDYNLQGTGLAFGNAYMWGHIEQLQRVVDSFSMDLSQHTIQVQMSDWYDEETKDNVTFNFTARVVTSSGETVVPTGIEFTAPSGVTATTNATLIDNVYHIECTLEGYIPESVVGIGAKENALGINIFTNVATVHDSIAIISSYEGRSGQDGQDGKDGTGIEIKGSVVNYFATKKEYTEAEKVNGAYLVSEKTEFVPGKGELSYYGAYLYEYDKEKNTTTITDAVRGDYYICQADRDLYLATVQDGVTLLVGNGLFWFNAGQIKGEDGADAVSVHVAPETVAVKEGNTSWSNISVNLHLGSAKIPYDTDGTKGGFECSVLGKSSTQVLDINGNVIDGLRWAFTTIDNGYTFLYRLKLQADKIVNATIPFTVTYDGVEYSRTITFRTIEKGDKGVPGIAGPMPRPRGEWDETTEYYYNDYVRDIVIFADNGVDKYYAVKNKGKVDPGISPDDESAWEQADLFQFVATKLLLANMAYIDNLMARNVVVADSDNKIEGGFCASTNETEGYNLGDYRLWLGAQLPANAPFRVDKNGHLHALSSELEGQLRVGTDNAYIKLEKDDEYNGARMVFFTKETWDSLPQEAAVMTVHSGGVNLTIHSTQYGDISIGDGRFEVSNAIIADGESGVVIGPWGFDVRLLDGSTKSLQEVIIGAERFWAFK